MTFVLVPLAKENMHNTNDMVIDHTELISFTQEIEKEYGFKFDFTFFDEFKPAGIDTWYLQIMTNKERVTPLIAES